MTLSHKIHSAVPVSVPGSCFFDQLRTQRATFVDFRTEIGRSPSSHFLFLNIARTPPHKVTLSSSTFRKLLACLAVLTSGEVLCLLNRVLDTFPKVKVSTPCLKTKRPREDAVQKGHMTFFNPHFPSQSANCSGQDNRGCFL